MNRPVMARKTELPLIAVALGRLKGRADLKFKQQASKQ